MYGIGIDINNFYDNYDGQLGLMLVPKPQYEKKLPNIYISILGITQVLEGECLIFSEFNLAFAHIFKLNKKLFLEG